MSSQQECEFREMWGNSVCRIFEKWHRLAIFGAKLIISEFFWPRAKVSGHFVRHRSDGKTQKVSLHGSRLSMNGEARVKRKDWFVTWHNIHTQQKSYCAWDSWHGAAYLFSELRGLRVPLEPLQPQPPPPTAVTNGIPRCFQSCWG